MNHKPKRPSKVTLEYLYGTHDFKTFTDTIPDYTPKPKQKRTKSKSNKETEHQLQRRIVVWFRKQYPEYKDCICYNDTNKQTKTSQMISRAMGLVSGRNDLSIYYRGRALLLELKIKTGTQSDNQQIFEQNMKLAGNHYRIAFEFEQAQDIIRKFITWCDEQ